MHSNLPSISSEALQHRSMETPMLPLVLNATIILAAIAN
jgi:hypothetical protein